MNIYTWAILFVISIIISSWFIRRKERRLSKIPELSAKDAKELSEMVSSSAKKIEKELFYRIKGAALDGRTNLRVVVKESNTNHYDIVVRDLEEKGYRAAWYYDAEIDKHLFNIEWD